MTPNCSCANTSTMACVCWLISWTIPPYWASNERGMMTRGNQFQKHGAQRYSISQEQNLQQVKNSWRISSRDSEINPWNSRNQINPWKKQSTNLLCSIYKQKKKLQREPCRRSFRKLISIGSFWENNDIFVRLGDTASIVLETPTRKTSIT